MAVQDKNVAWFLPRPKRDHYKGGMPLHCERWLINMAKKLLNTDNIKLLNVFCGMNTEGIRVDIKPEVKPDVLCDAHELTKHIKGKFDVIIADPPYSNDECKQLYNINIPLKYTKWAAECAKLLRVGGLLIVYHKYVMPNPIPGMFVVAKRVFIGSRSYHTPRVAIYFKKQRNKSDAK